MSTGNLAGEEGTREDQREGAPWDRPGNRPESRPGNAIVMSKLPVGYASFSSSGAYVVMKLLSSLLFFTLSV